MYEVYSYKAGINTVISCIIGEITKNIYLISFHER